MSFYSQQSTSHQGNNPSEFSGGYSPYDQQHQQQQQQQQHGVYNPTQQQQSQQQQAQPVPQQQQQQQQQGQHPTLWNPASVLTAAATGKGFSDDDKMDMVASAFKYSLDKSTANLIPGLSRLMTSLRIYFAVDNRYVLKKMQRLSFPFVFKQWRRLKLEPSYNPAGGVPSDAPPQAPLPSSSNLPEYALPIHDENAPDLYLPFMTLVTYVLLCAIVYGSSNEFTPAVIPDVTTKCLLTQLLEVLAIRLGFYLMQAPVAFLDLCAFTGYKYLGLCINMLLGMIIGFKGFYAALAYTALCTAFFLMKTLSNAIPKETAQGGPKREFVVLGCAASQFVTMWFLSQTKFLQ